MSLLIGRCPQIEQMKRERGYEAEAAARAKRSAEDDVWAVSQAYTRLKVETSQEIEELRARCASLEAQLSAVSTVYLPSMNAEYGYVSVWGEC